jgi:hypothetical protein
MICYPQLQRMHSHLNIRKGKTDTNFALENMSVLFRQGLFMKISTLILIKKMTLFFAWDSSTHTNFTISIED